MPVITLSRQMGSLGDDVAQAVAKQLGLRLVGRDLINRAAVAAGAPEVALAAIDELGLLGVKPSATALSLYRQKVTDVILDLAADGNVLVVGRGSQVVLAARPDTLHVRIIAPRDQRIATVQARCQVPVEVAAARIDASDRARVNYLQRHHGARLNDPALYDLIINMAGLDVETATSLVCVAAMRPRPARFTPVAATSKAEGCEE